METSCNVTRYPPVSLTLGRLSAYISFSSGKGRSHWQDPAGRFKAHAPTPDRAPFIYIIVSNLSQADLSWSFDRTDRRKIKLLNNINKFLRIGFAGSPISSIQTKRGTAATVCMAKVRRRPLLAAIPIANTSNTLQRTVVSTGSIVGVPSSNASSQLEWKSPDFGYCFLLYMHVYGLLWCFAFMFYTDYKKKTGVNWRCGDSSLKCSVADDWEFPPLIRRLDRLDQCLTSFKNTIINYSRIHKIIKKKCWQKT